MSVGAAREFLISLNHDQLLRDRLDRLNWDIEQTVRLAGEMGMVFDETELATAIQETGITLPPRG